MILFLIFAASVWLFAAGAGAQITYSIDSQGPTNGLPSGGLGAPITEGDILVPTPPAGPPPPPTVAIPGVVLGIVPTAGGANELDALSYGLDDVIFQNAPSYYYFSPDEFAVGLPGVPAPPNVTTEGAFGATEASADVYVFTPPPIVPPPAPIPPGPVFGNTGLFDGNGGITPFASPTLNLIEPNPPTLLAPVDPGDNLDALDVDLPEAPPGVFFSLDAAFVDPFEGPPINTGTAAANGVVGGDVLMPVGFGGPIAVYAPAAALGLDLAGPGTDDLDALILNDTTDGAPGVYTPTAGPYSWLGGTDMLLFSVRRGSALIGVLDGLFGAPIEPGDILVPMPGGGPPGIWIAAEALGLATVRSGAPLFPGPDGMLIGDDLDALDVTQTLVPEPSGLAVILASCLATLGRSRLRRRRARE